MTTCERLPEARQHQKNIITLPLSPRQERDTGTFSLRTELTTDRLCTHVTVIGLRTVFGPHGIRRKLSMLVQRHSSLVHKIWICKLCSKSGDAKRIHWVSIQIFPAKRKAPCFLIKLVVLLPASSLSVGWLVSIDSLLLNWRLSPNQGYVGSEADPVQQCNQFR